jgi:hypothetical protein
MRTTSASPAVVNDRAWSSVVGCSEESTRSVTTTQPMITSRTRRMLAEMTGRRLASSRMAG